MVGKYANQNPDQTRSPNPDQTLCKPTRHTNKKVCDEGANQPIKHNKEASACGRLPIKHNKKACDEGARLPINPITSANQ